MLPLLNAAAVVVVFFWGGNTPKIPPAHSKFLSQNSPPSPPVPSHARTHTHSSSVDECLRPKGILKFCSSSSASFSLRCRWWFSPGLPKLLANFAHLRDLPYFHHFRLCCCRIHEQFVVQVLRDDLQQQKRPQRSQNWQNSFKGSRLFSVN